MSTILEISELHSDVPVGTGKITNYGWSARAISFMLTHFGEEIRKSVTTVQAAFGSGKPLSEILTSLDPDVLAVVTEFVIPEAILFSTRFPRTDAAKLEEARERVRDLPFPTQAVLLTDAYNHTFPQGIGDFLTALGLGGGE